MKMHLRSIAALVFLLSALGGSSRSAKAQAISPCKAAQLQASEDRSDAHEISGGMGHQARVFALQNVSSTVCVLQGTPALTLTYTDTQKPFAVPVCANCADYLFQPQPVARVTLAPNSFAYVVVGFSNTDGLKPCTNPDPEQAAMTVGLFLPGQSGQTLTVSVPDWHSCGTLRITPFLAQPPQDGELAAK